MVVSSTILIVRYTLTTNNRSDYLLDKRIPRIVEGTARMVDTEAYFTKYDLQKSSIKLDLVCTNPNNLRITVGYKSHSEALTVAKTPIKEKVIWACSNLYPENSIDYLNEKSINDFNRISKEWDLLALGFDTSDYVKADERIWYLRIEDISGGPYGYEQNVTVEVNGTVCTMPEYFPNVYYIEEFKVAFNELIFETLLYPFFDGSKEVVIPIRGVNHELAIEDQKTNEEIRGMTINSYSTTWGGLGDNFWVVVFGTSNYLWQSASDFLFYPPMECRAFIQGCEWYGAIWQYANGMLDYGWKIAYCMDGDSQQTDMATCSQTDDNFLENMFDYVDGKLGIYGRLIVFVTSHGRAPYGSHMTISGKTRCWGFGYTNVIRLSEYENKIDDITSDGTHVLLWISACHGNGLDSFSSSDHNNCLESWSFRDEHEGSPALGAVVNEETCDYEDFCWLGYLDDEDNVVPQSEAAFFFAGAAEGSCQVTVTEIGPDAKEYYDARFSTTMYIQSTWGSHIFYINWGY